MKKNFALQAPGKADARVRDAIRHEVRKYVTRERRKTLPEGFEQWEFLCKVGATAESAETLGLKEIASAIDTVAATGVSSVYIEIIAAPAQRSRSPRV